MSIHCFKKENLHCIWDDSLVGKEVVVADSLSDLYEKLENYEVPFNNVVQGHKPAYPFNDSDGCPWRFAYVYEPPTICPGDSEVKQAYLQGHVIVRRYANGDWEGMSSTSYFDLPGYEYKIASDNSILSTKSRVSNKTLAMWLAGGNGLLLDVDSDYVKTCHSFAVDDMYCAVPDGYKVMLMGGSEWLEPTDDVVVCSEVGNG